VMLWLMPPGRPSLLGAVATRVNCITLYTASCLSGRRIDSRSLGDEGCPQSRDGTPPGHDGGAEHPSTGRSVRDRVSPHLAARLGCHHLRVPEDGRGSGQRPLHLQHGHLLSHLHDLGFSRGASSWQPLPLRIRSR
jgi:hypothetical protein